MRRTGSGECFVVRTLTLTPDGAKPIESFEIGQLVLSHDRHEGLVARAVTALQCHRCRVICRIMSAGAWLKGARRTQPNQDWRVLLGGQLGGTALLAPGVTIAARPRCPHAMGSFTARDELSRIKIGGCCSGGNSEARPCWRQV
jgi:hypothetical protein